jgi:hypothetical protein
MMTAQQVISTAYDAGITLTVVGGELKIKGKRGADLDRIVGLLKPVKAAVIDALAPVKSLPIEVEVKDQNDLQPTSELINSEVPKPPLPTELWITGATSFVSLEALAELQKNYTCTWGHDSRGYSVTYDANETSVTPVTEVQSAPLPEGIDIRTADPNAYIGHIIDAGQFDILAERGRSEGFGIQCLPQSEAYLCDWKLVKVWDLATGYNGDKLPTIDSPSLEVELTLDAETTDLFCFVGAIVTRPELDILQARTDAKGWTLHTLPTGDTFYITGVSESDNWHVDGPGPKCVLGNILVGGAEGEGNCYYSIKPGSPLYQRFATGKEYKAWLWPKIKDNLDGDADILAELYTIINAPWVGADIYVDGQHADVVVAAANYLLSKYSADGLPIFTKGKA